jgi:protein-L-isoaspartate(D-aspartate) O-methyltransferase
MMSSTSKAGQRSPGGWPRSCPRCGFDMEAGKPCKVCGYAPHSEQGRESQATGDRHAIKPLRLVALASIGILVVAVVGVLQREIQHRPTVVAVTPKLSDSFGSNPAPDSVRARPEDTKLSDLTAGANRVDIVLRGDNPPFSDRNGFVDWMVKHTGQQAKFLEARWDRAQKAQEFGNMTHERVREAFLSTPREYFCRNPSRAYDNAALPIGYGQTISGPHLVARMTDYLNPQPGQKVLEVGTGSGYQSALLSEISNHVFTIEIVEKLARETDAIFKKLEPHYPKYGNIRRKIDDGYYGWPEYAPFDRIIVTCGIDHVPPPLIRQLAPNGIMVIPVGPPSGQTILRIIKKVAPDGAITLEREDIYHGKKRQIFVPFLAKRGGIHRGAD